MHDIRRWPGTSRSRNSVGETRGKLCDEGLGVEREAGEGMLCTRWTGEKRESPPGRSGGGGAMRLDSLKIRMHPRIPSHYPVITESHVLSVPVGNDNSRFYFFLTLPFTLTLSLSVTCYRRRWTDCRVRSK